MHTLKPFLITRKEAVWCVSPDTTLKKTLVFMAEKDVGAVLVVENGQMVGIFSERDFARKAATMKQVPMHHPIREFMTKKRLRSVSPENTMEECMAIMTKHHVRHLPIIEHDKIVGIITIGDVVKHIIREEKYVLRKVLDSIEEGKKVLRMDIALNIEQNIMPLVKQLAHNRPHDSATFRLLEAHLGNIASDYYRKLVTSKFNFTPTEICIIKLIKANYREKEISEALGISISTVKKHKYAIRGKLGVRNKSGNITAYLEQID